MDNIIKVIFLTFIVITVTGQSVILSNPGCRRFGSTGQCLECSLRYYMDQNICQPVNPNCNTYNNINGDCLTCYQGFQLIQNTCLPTIAINPTGVSDVNCHKFSGSNCIECSTGFYFGSNGKCLQADPNCKTFNPQNGQCLSCYSGFALNNGQCLVSQNTFTDKFCKTFDTNGNCAQCSGGYYFNSQRVCTKIDDNCQNFNYATFKCQTCYQGYQLDSNLNCILSPPNTQNLLCRQWVNGICTECSQGSYFNSNGICVSVDPQCKVFNTTLRVCVSCYNGYILSQGSCIVSNNSNSNDPFCKTFNGPICLQCSYRYFRNSNNRCQLVNPLCKDFLQSNGQCTSCYLGFSLANGDCVATPTTVRDPLCSQWSNQTCIQCSAWSYFDSFQRCQAVDPLCRTYDSRTGACTSCYVAYKLNFDKCIVDTSFQLNDPFCNLFQNGRCVKCSQGYYFNPQQRCTQSDPSCNTFDPNNGNCLNCYSGYQLSNGKCIIVTIPNSDPNCVQYFNGACLKCSFRYYLGLNGTCTSVNLLCKDYSQTTGQCTSCYIGFQLTNGKCVFGVIKDSLCQSFIGDNCNRCVSGAFLNQVGICQLVTPNCNSYNTNTGQCFNCLPGYILNNQKCQLNNVVIPFCIQTTSDGSSCLKCAQGTYLNNQGLCIQIDPQCSNFDTLRSICLNCYTGYNLSNGRCIVVLAPSGNDINCQSYNPNGQCKQCFDRYFINSNGICQQVSVFCRQYNQDNGQCTACFTGFTFSGGRCLVN